jgi:hypothetical protein
LSVKSSVGVPVKVRRVRVRVRVRVPVRVRSSFRKAMKNKTKFKKGNINRNLGKRLISESERILIGAPRN